MWNLTFFSFLDADFAGFADLIRRDLQDLQDLQDFNFDSATDEYRFTRIVFLSA